MFKSGSLDQEYTVLNAVGGKTRQKKIAKAVPLRVILPGTRGLSEIRSPGAKLGQNRAKSRLFGNIFLFKNGSLDQEYTVLNAVGGKIRQKLR